MSDFRLRGRVSELVSGLIGTEVPRKGLRVRVPCPPLEEPRKVRMKRKFPPHFPGFLRFNACAEASQEPNVCRQPRLKHRVTEDTETLA
jgi:hypothetical protein